MNNFYQEIERLSEMWRSMQLIFLDLSNEWHGDGKRSFTTNLWEPCEQDGDRFLGGLHELEMAVSQAENYLNSQPHQSLY
ncbi:MAG: hypothetical protein IPK17_11375 [Chloroflexi bacterium]|uniref:hypothetical protein n=1 Tax=Candidatus Flexifilum breve TaxID=3140694 RepID=UPI0031352942|nr:hypothetical protein [Chloroflexota bacterium]